MLLIIIAALGLMGWQIRRCIQRERKLIRRVEALERIRYVPPVELKPVEVKPEAKPVEVKDAMIFAADMVIQHDWKTVYDSNKLVLWKQSEDVNRN